MFLRLKTLNGADGQKFVESPDGHWMLLMPDKSNESYSGIFRFVSIHVSDLAESVCFYRDALGAVVVANSANSAMIKFGEGVALELTQLEETLELERGDAFGRFAIETEDGGPMKISENIARFACDSNSCSKFTMPHLAVRLTPVHQV